MPRVPSRPSRRRQRTQAQQTIALLNGRIGFPERGSGVFTGTFLFGLARATAFMGDPHDPCSISIARHADP